MNMKARLNYYLQFSSIVVLIFITHYNDQDYQEQLFFSSLYILFFSSFMSTVTDFVYQRFLHHKSYFLNILKLFLFISIFIALLLTSIKYLEYINDENIQKLYGSFFTFTDKTGAWINFYQDQIVNNSFCFLGFSYFYLLDRNKRLLSDLNQTKIELTSIRILNKESILQSLQNQINPHFLFNSLNSIAGLIHDDKMKAKQMSSYLKTFFRNVTDTNEMFCSISEELKLVKLYLNIEKIRFNKRLVLEYDIDESVLNYKIPRLLIQPLVENAIKHGISPYQKRGKLSVIIIHENENILIKINDSGEHFSSHSKGYGLKNIKKRLQHFYGNKHRFSIENNSDGTVVTLTLPYQINLESPKN